MTTDPKEKAFIIKGILKSSVRLALIFNFVVLVFYIQEQDSKLMQILNFIPYIILFLYPLRTISKNARKEYYFGFEK